MSGASPQIVKTTNTTAEITADAVAYWYVTYTSTNYEQASAWLDPPGLQPLYLKRMRAVTAAPEGGLIVIWGPSFEDQQAASIAKQMRAYPDLPEYWDAIENDPDLSLFR